MYSQLIKHSLLIKVLKDITNRYKLLRGHLVNYTIGWDCHGLPIELKALKDPKNKQVNLKDPVNLRQAGNMFRNTYPLVFVFLYIFNAT